MVRCPRPFVSHAIRPWAPSLVSSIRIDTGCVHPPEPAEPSARRPPLGLPAPTLHQRTAARSTPLLCHPSRRSSRRRSGRTKSDTPPSVALAGARAAAPALPAIPSAATACSNTSTSSNSANANSQQVRRPETTNHCRRRPHPSTMHAHQRRRPPRTTRLRLQHHQPRKRAHPTDRPDRRRCTCMHANSS